MLGNVLMDFKSDTEYHFVICDFGFADYTLEAEKQFVAGMKKPTTMGMTIRYAAPEVRWPSNNNKQL